MVARDAGMLARDRQQVRRRVGDRLDARPLVIGDEGNVGRGLLDRRRVRFASNFGGTGFRRTQYGNFLIDTQDFGHLCLEFRSPPLQIVAHLVRLHLLLGEELANRALRDPRQAGVPRRWAMLAAMTGQQPRRPEFMRVSHLLGLPACQRHQPRPCWHCDLWLLARPRTVVERRHDPEPDGPCQATLHRLVRHTNGAADRAARRVIPIVQQHPGARHVARRLCPRTGDRPKLGQLGLPNG